MKFCEVCRWCRDAGQWRDLQQDWSAAEDPCRPTHSCSGVRQVSVEAERPGTQVLMMTKRSNVENTHTHRSDNTHLLCAGQLMQNRTSVKRSNTPGVSETGLKQIHPVFPCRAPTFVSRTPREAAFKTKLTNMIKDSQKISDEWEKNESESDITPWYQSPRGWDEAPPPPGSECENNVNEIFLKMR